MDVDVKFDFHIHLDMDLLFDFTCDLHVGSVSARLGVVQAQLDHKENMMLGRRR